MISLAIWPSRVSSSSVCFSNVFVASWQCSSSVGVLALVVDQQVLVVVVVHHQVLVDQQALVQVQVQALAAQRDGEELAALAEGVEGRGDDA